MIKKNESLPSVTPVMIKNNLLTFLNPNSTEFSLCFSCY